MPRFVKILLGTLAVLLLVGGGAFVWLTAREPVPETSDYVLSLDELRALADSLPGAKPVAVRSELVADAALPRGAVFAGESLREPHAMVHQVFQVDFGDPKGAVLIDSSFPQALFERMPGGEGKTYHAKAYARVLEAMRSARLIVITHEHSDHLMGVSGYAPAEDLVGRLRLTREQLANAKALDDASIPASLRAMEPLDYARTLAIAPGVVLQKAAGHTPGTQLVYVRTQDGRELLFVGDVAWHLDQLKQLHYRPRLVTDFFIGEDRRAVLAQFRALHDLLAAHPEVTVVVSHDPDQRQALIAAGTLREGLALAEP
jgi:glyoxylase-like metal-dependent hydrolase (beta-lactamase superfamily II)